MFSDYNPYEAQTTYRGSGGGGRGGSNHNPYEAQTTHRGSGGGGFFSGEGTQSSQSGGGEKVHIMSSNSH